MVNSLCIKRNRVQTQRILLKLFVGALSIRIIALFLVLLFSDVMETGFLGSDSNVDDWRYLRGAEIYSANATKLFDFQAFLNAYRSLHDWVGYHVKYQGLFNATPLWYFICCGLLYLFKSTIIVQLLTIVCGSLSVIYIYKYCIYMYDSKTALIAARIFAFTPYSVIFSCFAYKDHLFLLLIFMLYTKSAKYRVYRKLEIRECFGCAIVIIALLLLRSGFTILIIGVAFVIAINPSLKNIENNRKKIIFFLCVIGLVGFIFGIRLFWPLIQYKLGAYLDGRGEKLSTSTITFLTVNSIFDIYKLPLTYLFASVSPINVLCKPKSWFDIVCTLNLSLCPISVGSLMYFFEKKKNNQVYYFTLSLFLIAIVISINIFRHYYSLLPFIMIYFSHFWVISDKNKKKLCIIGSFLYSTVLISFFAIKNLR